MEEKDADLLAVGAARHLVGIDGLVDHHAHVPVETHFLNAEDVLRLLERNIVFRQNRLGPGDDLVARKFLRRFPSSHSGASLSLF
jgi:hypothetical protein